jgi:LmbE family N-acetylglucosaminyl deacetylase
MPVRRAVGAVAGVAGVIACAAAVLQARQAPPPRELDLPSGDAVRLLVLAPHPDDEALGAAGLIQRVLASGGAVRVVMMTSGDAFPEGVETATHIRRPTPRDFRNYGNLRERETIGAMGRLGLDRAHLLFLGFPDGGLCLIAADDLSKRQTFESPYTGRSAPPEPEQMLPGLVYRGSDIRQELEAILEAYRPTMLALPDSDDQHPDHCATALFMREALAAVAARHRPVAPHVLQYLIHTDSWPNMDEEPDALLQPPEAGAMTGRPWRTLSLTPHETAEKRRALTTYASQWLVIGRFLRAFGRPNELFTDGWPALPSECWCDASHVAAERPPPRLGRRPPP